MGEKFWDSFPLAQGQRFYFEMTEIERKQLENDLQAAKERLAKLEAHFRDEKKNAFPDPQDADALQ